MRTQAIVVCSLFFVLSIVPVQAAYQTGFEAPTYAVGNADGQDGWAVTAGTADIQTGTVNSGAQALRVNSDGYVTRSVSQDGMTVWVESYLQATPSAQPLPDADPRSASLYFDETTGIMCLDGDGTGGGAWTATGIGAQAGTWYRVTVRLDFHTQTWDCFVDGNLVLTDLGFKDNSVTSLSGIALRAQSGGTTFADDMMVDNGPPVGIPDADGDGLLDVAEDPNPPAGGRSNRFLPDSDGDGLGDAIEDANRNGILDGGETGTRTADSDGDSYEDGVEVFLLGSDPLNASDPGSPITDADSDSLPAGTDLNDGNNDIDGDGIDDGFEAVSLGLAASNNGSVTPPLGDVNLDGSSSNLDALITQALFLGNSAFGDFAGSGNADPNRDGSVTNVDALVIQAFFLENISTVPLRL